MQNVSIVIPAKDEADTLGDVLQDLYNTLPGISGYQFEVICVDDHSEDNTAEIAQGFGAQVIKNERKPGKGHALRTGFGVANGDILVMLDADYSHRPDDLPLFLEELKGDVGLVIGSRVIGGSEEYTHIRAFGNVFLSTALGVFTGCHLTDALNGYKVFLRDIFTDFDYTSKTFEMEIEIIANTLRKGYRIVEVSSHERARAGGEAKSFVVRHGTRFLLRIMYEGFRGVKPAEDYEDRS
jgi:glycosyltransferase involved in cell wall biosynthesis